MNNLRVSRLSTEDCMTEDDFLYELQKEVLNTSRHFLCEHLDPQRLFPYLQSKHRLSFEDCEEIRRSSTSRDKVNKLIDIIIKSGPGGLMKIISAIKKTCKTQMFIAEKLEKNLEKLMNIEDNKTKLQLIRGFGPTNRSTSPPPPYSPPQKNINRNIYPSPGVPIVQPLMLSSQFDVTIPHSTSPRTPVIGDWPSGRDRAETSSSYQTVHLMNGLAPFQLDEDAGNGFLSQNDQENKMEHFNSLRNMDSQAAQISDEDSSKADSFQENSLTNQDMPRRQRLQRQPRCPDEHENATIEAAEFDCLENQVSPLSLDSAASPTPFAQSFQSNFYDYTAPDDASFEVSISS